MRGAALPLLDAEDLVIFESFFSHGFGLPTSIFFCRVLEFYQIDLVNLNPNSILHLSIFSHFCEAFLGIPPHFGLFKYLFYLRVQFVRGETKVIGGAGFQFKEERKNFYLDYSLPTSNKGWHSQRFYCNNHVPSLPTNYSRIPTSSPRWQAEPTSPELEEARELLKFVEEALKSRVTGARVARIRFQWSSARKPMTMKELPTYKEDIAIS